MGVFNNEALQSFFTHINSDRKFYVVKESFGNCKLPLCFSGIPIVSRIFSGLNLYSYLAKDNSVFTPSIENCLGQMKAAGLFAKFDEWSWTQISTSYMRKLNREKENIIYFEAFERNLQLVLIVYSVSIMIFLGEVIFFRLSGSIKNSFFRFKTNTLRRYYSLRLRFEFVM